jgi:biopolymer transport protein ExbB/biopolymer transport protein TolQ
MGLNDAWITGIGPLAFAVLATLLLMSVASIAISIDRAWAFRRAIARSRRCTVDVHPLVRKRDWRAAHVAAVEWHQRHAPMGTVIGAGLAEWIAWQAEDDDRALFAVREAAAFTTEMALADMRRGLSALATIGSTAPFVGLFGTTFGIIHAFSAISITGSAQMGAISAGISEALVTTAFGLFVAIPAVWAYNAFLGKLEVLRVELERGRYLLLEQLGRPA